MGRSRLQKNLLSVGGILICSKLLGFVKQMILAATYGATIETDLIGLSYGFIGDAQYMFVQVLLTCIVPVYFSAQERSQQEAKIFARDTLTVATATAVLLSGLIIVTSPWISRLLAPTYSETLLLKLENYICIFAPLLIFFIWSGVSHALLNAEKRFTAGQMEGLYQSIILSIIALTTASQLGVDGLSTGYWIAGVITAAILLLQAKTYIAPFHCHNPFHNPNVCRLLKMVAPLLVGYSAVYVNQMVDKILVSGLEYGTVTAMSYAAVLSNLVGTFICSICSVLYAHISEQIAKGNQKNVVKLAESSTCLFTLLMLPISVITICQAKDIISIVYGRGAFGEKEVKLAAFVLAGYGFSFIPLVWREIYSQLQYGSQDSRHPTQNSVIGIVINIILSIALCLHLGVFGVAVATSISVCAIGILNMITSRHVVQELSFGWLRKSVIFLLIGGIACTIICEKLSMLLVEYSAIFRFIIITITVMGIYGIIILPLLWKLGYLEELRTRRRGQRKD